MVFGTKKPMVGANHTILEDIGVVRKLVNDEVRKNLLQLARQNILVQPLPAVDTASLIRFTGHLLFVSQVVPTFVLSY